MVLLGLAGEVIAAGQATGTALGKTMKSVFRCA